MNGFMGPVANLGPGARVPSHPFVLDGCRITAEACHTQSNEEGKAEETPVKFVLVALAALLFVAILTAVEWLGDRKQLRDTAAQRRAGRERFRDKKERQ
jgi:hypothetical protein